MRASCGARGSVAQDVMINPLDSYNIRVVTPTSCDKYPGRYTSPYSAHRKDGMPSFAFLFPPLPSHMPVCYSTESRPVIV